MDREALLRRHEELLAQGWVRRFTAEEPRVSEMKEAYESMGLEVRIETGGVVEPGQDCSSCLDLPGFSGLYKTIYTRGEPKAARRDDELYE
ncbi:MAG: hypothetical protein FJ118_12070 [Deltaproteobacteria bacterium]|nr:hypothetical protein [Deltaproteobacteria bacterium]